MSSSQLTQQVITSLIEISTMKVLLTLDESSLIDVNQNGYDYTRLDDMIQVKLDQIKYDPTSNYSDPIEQLCQHYLLNVNDVFYVENL